MMLKNHVKYAGKLLMTLILGIVIGFVLLLAVYALPVEPMAANVQASVPALNGEWGEELSYYQLIPGYITTQLDNSTDASMLLAAVHDCDEPLTRRVAQGYRYSGGDNPFLGLIEFGEIGDQMATGEVARYWHGYLVFLKPLLLVMSYLDIRMFLMMAQGAMMAAVVAGLVRRNHLTLIPAFLLSLIGITPSVTGFSLQFSTVFCIVLVQLIVLLYQPEEKVRQKGLSMFFLLSGMATSYIDYLTYPIATLGMPLCLSLFLDPKDNLKDEFKRFVGWCVCWAVGYAGMWVGKWVIVSIFGDAKWFWANTFAKIQERSSSESKGVDINYLVVLGRVIQPFIKRAYLAAFVSAGIAWLWKYVRVRRLPARYARNGRSILLLVTALMPFAWYFVTQNHTYQHAFFTSRGVCVAFFAIGCALFSLLDRKEKAE